MSLKHFPYELIVIGVSAGGVDILNEILPTLKPGGKMSVVVVIHLPSEGPNLLTSLFEPSCQLSVKEAEPGETLAPDTIYFAPPDYHLCLEPNKTLSLSSEEPLNFSRPSIDILFESAAYAFGKKVVGVLLTGANDDGARGLKMIKDMGGLTIVQDPRDAQYKTMPSSAIEMMSPDKILNRKEITTYLCKLVSGGGHA